MVRRHCSRQQTDLKDTHHLVNQACNGPRSVPYHRRRRTISQTHTQSATCVNLPIRTGPTGCEHFRFLGVLVSVVVS